MTPEGQKNGFFAKIFSCHLLWVHWLHFDWKKKIHPPKIFFHFDILNFWCLWNFWQISRWSNSHFLPLRKTAVKHANFVQFFNVIPVLISKYNQLSTWTGIFWKKQAQLRWEPEQELLYFCHALSVHLLDLLVEIMNIDRGYHLWNILSFSGRQYDYFLWIYCSIHNIAWARFY